MAFLNNTPRCGNKFVTVGDAISKLKAFDVIYEMNNENALAGCPWDENQKAAWRKAIREGVVNCAGVPTELDFFEKAFNASGKTKVEATDLYIKSNCDVDYNVLAAAPSVGASPGAAAQFTLSRVNHDASGQYSNVAVNGNIYIYEDKQWVRITAIDKTVDFAHVVTVVPWNADYTVNIRKDRKMMFNPVRFVDGLSCAIPSSTWMTPGYVNKVSPIFLRKDWEQPMDLSRGYQEVLQWAVTYDINGKEVDSWVLYEQTKAREQFKYMKNLAFFMGSKIDNPLLIGEGLTLTTNKYTGFDGYLNTMYFGGGNVKDYDTASGVSLDADFLPIILQQDSMKKSKNFLVMYGLPLMAALIRNNNELFKNSTGSLNLAAFMQLGMKKSDIEKLDITSYQYLNYNFSFKVMDALSDTRGIGNSNMPYLGMMMPLDLMPDSKGKPTPAIEMFEPTGNGASGSYFESPVLDHRFTENHCDKWSSYIQETIMMNVNCPQNHILLNGVAPCA